MGDYFKKTFGLEGRVAIITGGGGTLCSAIAAHFLAAGASVSLWDVRADATAEKAKKLAGGGADKSKIASCAVDLMKEDSIRAALAETVKRFGRADILLNGCGGNRGKAPLTETKVEDFEFVMKLNLLAGCFTPTKVVADYWVREKVKGVVINIASMAAFVPLSGVWAYSAAKAAVRNQTMAYAKELAPYGIRVNAIAPGFFLADQNRALLVDEKTGKPTQRGKDVLAHTPYGRFGEPEELGPVCVMLAADAASGFITGVTLPIDGGYLVQNI